MKLPTVFDPIRRCVKILWPIEIFTLIQVGSTVAFLKMNHLRADWHGFWYIVRPLAVSLPFYLIFGVVATLLIRAGLDRSFRPILARLRTPGYYVGWLRVWIVMLLGTYSYAWLKISVPMVNANLWDPQLWDLDRWLLGGVSPSLFLTQLFSDSLLAHWIDLWYNFWVTSVLICIIFVTAFHEDEDRRVIVTAECLLWCFGAWMYVSMPALGPIFAFPEAWNELSAVLYPKALGTQMGLWLNYQSIQEGIASGQLKSFNPTRGIAAMPSLHVGTHVLFAIWAWSRLRPLFVIFLLAAIFTFLGSILTGWHYAIDGLVGAALAWFSLFLARRFAFWDRQIPVTTPSHEP